MRLCAAPSSLPPDTKNTGRSGASAEGSTPSWMIMLRSRYLRSGSSIWPATQAPMASPTYLGGEPTPMPFTFSVPPRANAMMSPLAEKPSPSRSESLRPPPTDRTRVSGEAQRPAEPVGELEAALTRSRRDLGRAERAGGKDHAPGLDKAWARVLGV